MIVVYEQLYNKSNYSCILIGSYDLLEDRRIDDTVSPGNCKFILSLEYLVIKAPRDSISEHIQMHASAHP